MKLDGLAMVEFPGHVLHKRIGTITQVAETPDFGRLYTLHISGFLPISLTGPYLRPILRRTLRRPFDKRSGGKTS